MPYRPLAIAIALSLSAPALAQSAAAPAPAPAGQVHAAPAFTARVNQLPAILSGTGDYAGFFSPSFREKVPQAQFEAINKQIAASLGPVTGIEAIDQATPFAGMITMGFRDGTAKIRIAIDEAAPNQVSGLRILEMGPRLKSVAEVEAAFSALPGASGVAVARLGAGAPQMLAGYEADKRLAVGSAFKLVILAELVRSVNAGERKWSDTIPRPDMALPGGAYAFVPKGAPLPLREVAEKMISVSDNSATDILLHLAGRERVEAMLRTIGVAEDPRNHPYLSTLEAFKLKWLEGGALADRFNALDEKGQRAMLAADVARADPAPLAAMREVPRTPSRIDTLEWFFSASDLIRVMDWLRRNSEGAAGADTRAILSKSRGVPLSPAKWPWVGFKGGSEPGVLNLTLLLQGADGNWYAAAASWNDPAKEVDTGKLVGLTTAAVNLAAK